MVCRSMGGVGPSVADVLQWFVCGWRLVTIFDYVVLGVLGASCVLGLWRGLVSEVLALLAWVVAFFVARQWAYLAAPWFEGLTVEPALHYAGGFVTVFIGVLIVFGLGRLALTFVLRAVGLGLTDRLLGVVFGFVRGLAIVLVAVLLAGLTTMPKEVWWQQASLAPPLETAVIAAKPYLPSEIAQRIRYR